MSAACKAMREGARIAPERSCPEFVDAIAAMNDGIADPVDKLHYLRVSLNLHPDSERALRHVPSSSARRWLAKLVSAIALQQCLRSQPIATTADMRFDALRTVARTRRAAVVCASVLTLACTFLMWRTLPGMLQPHTAVASVQTHIDAVPPQAIVNTPRHSAPEQSPAAEFIAPPAPQELTANIWLVDKAEGWELYSNGLRIETAFETDGAPRRFAVFAANEMEPVATETQPVGILMHTSESDLWPFEETFNANLRKGSRSLLRYVQRLQLYNYVIDRFGRVYRVVRDETRAHHAGRGVWAHDDRYYLNLNSAMLGVCFETRWNGGSALPITEAQLLAGRHLTAYLRQRYSIAPDMVAAHGLTSVNAKAHLIGHHLDWARGFPFEAFGLPNQYARQPPSVAKFGFAYDAKFLEAMGKPWPGLERAEAALAAEAAASGITVGELRARKQALYDTWSRAQDRDGPAALDSKDPHTAAQAALKP